MEYYVALKFFLYIFQHKWSSKQYGNESYGRKYIILYISIIENANSETKLRISVVRGWEDRRIGSYFSMDAGLCLGDIKFLKIDNDNNCIAVYA